MVTFKHTRAEIEALAAEAENITISSWDGLDPIFAKFPNHPKHCFDYLVEKEVIPPEKYESMKNAFHVFWRKQKAKREEVTETTEETV
ncbi:MAG: hypothetical protein AAF226_05495 [Verrucomicrobiota bacterium]